MIGVLPHPLRRCVAIVLLAPVLTFVPCAGNAQKSASVDNAEQTDLESLAKKYGVTYAPPPRDADAQYSLGLKYYLGQDVAQDYAQAFKWFSLAAEQGSASAQAMLSTMYKDGEGVSQNYKQAFAWSRPAAEQGDADGQAQVGARYFSGFGVPQHFILSHIWMNLSCAAGNQDAEKLRKVVANEMSSTHIAEAQRLVAEWKPKTPSPK